MIDTSIVRVQQHAACIARNNKQSVGRSQGGLTAARALFVSRPCIRATLVWRFGPARQDAPAGRPVREFAEGIEETFADGLAFEPPRERPRPRRLIAFGRPGLYRTDLPGRFRGPASGPDFQSRAGRG
jgi:hypothetical protein